MMKLMMKLMLMFFLALYLLLTAPLKAQADIAKSIDIAVMIANSQESLVKIKDGIKQPILFIQGLDLAEVPTEWLKPFELAMNSEHSVYFFKWSKFDSIYKNRNLLLEAIKFLLSTYQDSNLTLVGYSAGGIIALLALDAIVDSIDPELSVARINVQLVAAPVFGYNINKRPVTYLAVPFAGATSVKIGIGVFENLKNKNFKGCHQWITTNCHLDKHACIKGSIYPQQGDTAKARVKICETVSYLNNETHASILAKAVSQILK